MAENAFVYTCKRKIGGALCLFNQNMETDPLDMTRQI